MGDVVVDQSGEPWVASFAGLGSVHIHADGTVNVTVDDASTSVDTVCEGTATTELAESATVRESALRHGWGEPLSFIRRGFRLLRGTALVAADRPGCLVVTGSASHTAMVTASLVADGWSVLADGVVPVATGDDGTIGIDGAVVAYPRTATLLLPRRWARKSGLDAIEVRADTDAVAVAVARTTTPQTLVAVAHIRIRRPHDDVIRPLRGFEPFEQAAALLIANPALRPPATTPTVELANHTLLAAVAHAEVSVRSDTLAADIAAVEQWWQAMTEPGEARSKEVRSNEGRP